MNFEPLCIHVYLHVMHIQVYIWDLGRYERYVASFTSKMRTDLVSNDKLVAVVLGDLHSEGGTLK